MKSSESLVDRVVLPLHTRGEEGDLILAANVLASWFRVPLHMLTPDDEAAEACTSLASTLGVPTEPVTRIDAPSFIDGTIDHLRDAGSVVCVTKASRGGLDVARRAEQLVLLVGNPHQARVATGPMVVEVTGNGDADHVLATVASWASFLECGVRLVVNGLQTTSDAVERAAGKLREIGIEVGIDELRPTHEPPLVLCGRTRDSTAIVIASSDPRAPELLSRAEEAGVTALVVPDTTARTRPVPKPTSGEVDGSTEAIKLGPNLEAMTYDQCVDELAKLSVARVGYVDSGWPTVVPVNYAVRNGLIFIRTQEGGKLEAARRNDVVCFEVDDTDVSTRTGWSVVAHGALQVVQDPGTLLDAWEADPSPWIEGGRWHWLQLVPFSLTGRRVTANRSPVSVRE